MKMSVAGRFAIGVVSCCGFAFAALLFVYAVSPWVDQKQIPFFGTPASDTVLFGTAGAFCALVNIRLLQRRRWAWWTAFSVSLLTLGFGMLVFFSALHPKNDFARSESGFGIGISLILVTPSLITSVLLALPSVRRVFGFDAVAS